MSRLLWGVLVALVLALPANLAWAESQTEDRLEQLERKLEAQQAEIEELRKQAAEEAEEAPDEGPGGGASGFEAIRKDGFYIQTTDKEFKIQFAGRVQADGRFLQANHPTDNHFRIRRARMGMKGTLYDIYKFKVEGDFSGSTVLTDGYVEIDPWDEFSLKGGQFKEPFSYEQLTSSRYIKFVERSLLADNLTPGRDVGFMISGELFEGVLGYQIGVFNGEGQNGRDSDDDKEWAARLALAPFTTSDVEALTKLHLGFAITYGLEDTDSIGGDSLETAVDTDFFEIDTNAEVDGRRLRIGGELAYFFGPFAASAEIAVVSQDDIFIGATEEDLDIVAWYLQASFMITGEDIQHSRQRVDNPFNPAADEWGTGAWEVAVRVEQIDIDDDIITAGLASGSEDAFALTIGVNWYLNDFTLMRFNWVRTELDTPPRIAGVGEGEDAFLMRLQIEF